MRRIEQITPQVIDVMVYLEVEKNVHRVEILYKFSHFKVVTSGAADDMYQAIHLAIMRLRRKLSKWKTRIQNHHAKKFSQVELSVNVLDQAKEDLNEINDEIEEENLVHVEHELEPAKIVKTKKRPLKTLTTDEAVMKRELTDDHFMVYRSEEDQKIKVIYVRRDKTLGVIEVE
jgi:putative sigma-54 modulation protein